MFKYCYHNTLNFYHWDREDTDGECFLFLICSYTRGTSHKLMTVLNSSPPIMAIPRGAVCFLHFLPGQGTLVSFKPIIAVLVIKIGRKRLSTILCSYGICSSLLLSDCFGTHNNNQNRVGHSYTDSHNTSHKGLNIYGIPLLSIIKTWNQQVLKVRIIWKDLNIKDWK